MDASVIFGIIGVIAAFFGAGVGYWFGRRSEFAVAEWMREVRSWASKVINVLSQASYGAKAKESGPMEQVRWAQELSALIEMGRFYLPNQRQDEYGMDSMDKPLAYRGFRHAALDPLVAAVWAIEGDAKSTVPKAAILKELNREFVSALFRILGPEHHNREVARIIRTGHSSRTDDLTVGGLLPGESIPPGAKAVLQKVISRVEGRSSVPITESKQNDS